MKIAITVDLDERVRRAFRARTHSDGKAATRAECKRAIDALITAFIADVCTEYDNATDHPQHKGDTTCK